MAKKTLAFLCYFNIYIICVYRQKKAYPYMTNQHIAYLNQE